MKTFPTLYSRSSTGAVLVWDISADLGVITTKWGQEGGAIQTAQDIISSGKNIGKKNETTPEQQAELEATSSWTYQQERAGYVTDKSKIDQDERIGVEPMLAHHYDKNPEKIDFPCFIQPKLDGHRCLAVIDTFGCTLYSRSRTIITGVPHINEALAETYKMLVLYNGPITLDGELYNHEYRNKFEELAGFIRSQIPKDGHMAVQYHIYDVVDTKSSFIMRNKLINDLSGLAIMSGYSDLLKFVETLLVEQEYVTMQFRYFRDQGYEGAILRNCETVYEQKRSYGLQKVKEFEDAEFVITGVKEGKGKLRGHAIFECTLEDKSTTFDVKLKGEEARLKEIFENPVAYLGKPLTVQFQGRTKNNIPRFPVGLRLREDV